MAIYITILIAYILGSLFEEQYIRRGRSGFGLKEWNLILVFPLWFFISFRNSTVGNDTQMYKYLYETFAERDLAHAFQGTHMERGFVLFLHFLGKLGISYLGFQIIIATIICVCFASFIYRYSSNYAYSWFLFVTLLSFSRSMNIIREMFTVGLSLFLVTALLDKKIGRFIAGTIVLFFFHRTAIFMLLLLLFVFIKNENLKRFLTIIGSAILAVFFSGIFSIAVSLVNKYSYLIDGIYTDITGGFAQYINILFAISIMVIFSLTCSNNDFGHENNSFRNCALDEKYQISVWKAYLYVAIIFAFGGLRFGMMDRAGLYYSSIYLVLIPNSINRDRLPNNRIIIYTILTTLLFIYFVCVMLLRNIWQGSLPYTFVWSK